MLTHVSLSHAVCNTVFVFSEYLRYILISVYLPDIQTVSHIKSGVTGLNKQAVVINTVLSECL